MKQPSCLQAIGAAGRRLEKRMHPAEFLLLVAVANGAVFNEDSILNHISNAELDGLAELFVAIQGLSRNITGKEATIDIIAVEFAYLMGKHDAISLSDLLKKLEGK